MKSLKFFAVFAAAASILAACNKNEGPEGQKGGENTPIVLKASTTTPAMSTDTQNEEVLSLSWNATTNMGTGARIDYSLLIDRKGGNFESAEEIVLGAKVTSYSFTAVELNKIIKETFGYQNEEVAEMDFCVYATIKSDEVDDVVSNTVTISLTAFEPKPTALYMIGSATSAGWNLDDAVEMTPIEGEDGGFTWAGELFSGELKFLVTKDGWIPSFGRVDDNTLYYRDHYWDDENGNRVDDESLPHVDTPDEKFIIAEQGNYKIVLNIEKLTITITKTGGPRYFSMYMVGSAVEAPVSLYRSSYAFFKGINLGAGKAHFSVSEDNSGDFFYAAAEGQALSETAVSQTSGIDWNISNPGLYHVSLFIKDGKEKAYFVEASFYEELYIIGSACDAGWDIANALPMTKSSQYVQSWTGALKEGELKFSCDRQTDWFGAWYLASTPEKAPTGEEEPVIFLDKARSETGTLGIREFDQKWIISNPGIYTITLDQLKETVTIKKN